MRGLLFFGIGLLIGYELSKKKAAGPILPPYTTPPVMMPQLPLDQLSQPTVNFFPSFLPGGRPDQPYQVRWGSGNKYQATTRASRLVI